MTRRLTRRRFAKTLAASGLAAGAGCTDPGGDTVEGSVEDDPDVFGVPFRYVTEDTQVNRFAGGFPWTVHALLFEPGVVSTPDGRYETTDLVESVEVDGTSVRVTYADGFRWWNGEPVTARDRYVHERLWSFVRSVGEDGPPPSAADESVDPSTTGRAAVDLVDDRTLVYEFPRPLARPVALERTLGEAHTVAAWHFEPWLERLTDASTDAAREDVVEDLRAHSIPLDEARTRGYGCGSYRLREVSPNRILLDPFEDHPRHDRLGVSRIWFPVARGRQLEGLVGNGAIDGFHGTRDWSTPDHVERLARYHTAAGTKIALNWRNRHVARKPVRRALAALLPLRDAVEVGGFGEVAAVQTGMTIPAQRRWLDADVRERLHRYPVEADPDRAAEYLRDAGYGREDERWIGPDGHQVALRLRTPIWDEWFSATQVLEEELRSFGFEIERKQVHEGGLFATIQDGDFDLLLWPTDGRARAAYDVTAEYVSGLGYAVEDPDAETSQFEKPIRPLVPREPGALDADEDDRERVNLVECWRRIEGPSEETADAVATFARWWNDALPDIDLATGRRSVWGNTRAFDWPDAGDRRYRRTAAEDQPVPWLLATGAIARDR